jgi:hypothetical protein
MTIAAAAMLMDLHAMTGLPKRSPNRVSMSSIQESAIQSTKPCAGEIADHPQMVPVKPTLKWCLSNHLLLAQ